MLSRVSRERLEREVRGVEEVRGRDSPWVLGEEGVVVGLLVAGQGDSGANRLVRGELHHALHAASAHCGLAAVRTGEERYVQNRPRVHSCCGTAAHSPRPPLAADQHACPLPTRCAPTCRCHPAQLPQPAPPQPAPACVSDPPLPPAAAGVLQPAARRARPIAAPRCRSLRASLRVCAGVDLEPDNISVLVRRGGGGGRRVGTESWGRRWLGVRGWRWTCAAS